MDPRSRRVQPRKMCKYETVATSQRFHNYRIYLSPHPTPHHPPMALSKSVGSLFVVAPIYFVGVGVVGACFIMSF